MQNEHNMKVASSPHIRRARTTSTIMLDVILALLPAGAAGVFYFGTRALLVILLAVVGAVASEFLYNRLTHRKQTIGDFSAVVTGLLLAYNMPVSVPLWMPVVGAVLAIVLVKMFFGGIGCNFVNPALAARAILMTSWVDHMSGQAFSVAVRGVDAVTGATPLTEEYRLLDLLLGRTPGCIGEVCRAAILLGAIYLVIRRVIAWQIPVTMLGTVFILSYLTSGELTAGLDSAVYQLLSGGLMLGAWFMATDYTTSPVSTRGRVLFGVGCGLIVFVIRRFSSMPEGTSYAILFMNLTVPLIDRYIRPSVFGRGKKRG